jgi:hypothetical protein
METHFMEFKLQELNKRMSESVVGYLSMNLYDPPAGATWGLYNDRKISHVWVRRLAEDFRRKMENCSEKEGIDIAIQPEWLKNRADILTKIDGKEIKDVPVMEFTEEGQKAISKSNLILLGGNHRREAVLMHVKWLEKEAEKKEAVLSKKEEDLGVDLVGPAVQEVKKLRESVEELKRRMDDAKYWAVRIYDKGERIQ